MVILKLILAYLVHANAIIASMRQHLTSGFTIVEMMTVIIILGILGSLTAFSFGNWQAQMAENELESDLRIAGSALSSAKAFSSASLTSIPSKYNPSKNIVMEATNAPSGQYCLNAYHIKYTSLRKSIRSGDTAPSDGLCPWGGSGSIVGGTVPAAPKGTNVALAFSDWTLSGTPTYNASTKQITMGTNGTIASPLTRVNGASGIAINGQFYATVASANASTQPDGGWHVNIAYFGNDGVTPVANTSGYTSNGCARKVQLGSWNASMNGACSFALGNGIAYVRVTAYSSASGYASTDLLMRSPSFILN